MASTAEYRAGKLGTSAQVEPSDRIAELAQQALDALERDASEIGHATAQGMREEIEAVAAAADREPELPARLVMIAEHSVRTLVTVTREHREPTHYELAFIHEVAMRRAADGFPLDALLHGLRIGQRLIWQHIVAHVADDPLAHQVIVWLTEQTLRYTDSLSAAMAGTYAGTQQARAADNLRRRTELLEEIVSGRFPYRSETLAVVTSLGLDPEQPCAVLVAVEVDARAPSDPVVRERVRAALERHARRHSARSLIVARDSDVVAIISPPAPARAIGSATLADLRPSIGDGLAVGLSDTCPTLGDAARGHAEALRATAVVRHTGGIAAIREIRLIDYLAAHADSTARRLLPRATTTLADRTNGAPLAQTLEAYLDSDLSVPATAARLSVHPNTVRYRLERIEQLTGLDTRRFWDLAELAAAHRILAHGEPSSGSRIAPRASPPHAARRPPGRSRH
jgi:hypothetical protein